MSTFDNAITSLKQLDEVLDILQGKKNHTNKDLVAMVLVVAEMEKIGNVPCCYFGFEKKKYDKLERLALDMGYARSNIINPVIYSICKTNL